jgi:hypothetical protein
MGIDSHLSTCVDTQSPKYLEMAQGHISLSVGASTVESMSGSGGGTVPISGAHRTERATSEWAVSTDARGPWGRERRGHTREGSWCRQLGPTGQREGERGAHGRGLTPTGGDHLLEGGGHGGGA